MTLANSDQATRFLLPELGIRGVAVHLADSAERIRDRPDYTEAVSHLLGEATAATVILGHHIKVDGRLSLQLKTDGDLRTLFTESTAQGTVRGIAQIAEGATGPEVRDLTALGGDRLLAITIENKGVGNREMQQYQGLVAVDRPTLAEAIEQYFVQSEQLPTRLLLAADKGHAAGLMLQKLPGSDDRDRDGWDRALALFETLGEQELLDLPSAEVLHRLFHDETLQILEQSPVTFACSCSRERAQDMLISLGPDPEGDGLDHPTDVKCEFCGEDYHFTAGEMAVIHASSQTEQSGPVTLQ